jgi:endonuclease YncB( thermonuclease family)
LHEVITLQGLIRRVVGLHSLTDPTKDGPIRVLDGDDVEWRGKQYRLEGFDAPEISPASLRSEISKDLELERGLKAKRRLQFLIEHSTVVDLIPGKLLHDRRERQLAKLLLNGKDMAEIATAERWAERYRKYDKMDWGRDDAPFDDSLPAFGSDQPDPPPAMN